MSYTGKISLNSKCRDSKIESALGSGKSGEFQQETQVFAWPSKSYVLLLRDDSSDTEASLCQENISLLLFQAAAGYSPDPADQQHAHKRDTVAVAMSGCGACHCRSLENRRRVSIRNVLCCLHRGRADFLRTNIIFPSEGVLLRDNK